MNRSEMIAAVEALPLGPSTPVLICGKCGGRDTLIASSTLSKICIACAICGYMYEFDRDTGEMV
jgi:hypothetical protein